MDRESLDAAAGKASKGGWRLIGEAGYLKDQAIGGGTAGLSRDGGAVRPAP